MEQWNHFDTEGPRTNNNLEGYNLKLKKYVAIAHPDIFKSIQVFQSEEADSSMKFMHAKNGDSPPHRRKLNIINDRIFVTLKNLLAKKLISLDGYVEEVRNIFEIKENVKAVDDRDTDSEESSEDDP